MADGQLPINPGVAPPTGINIDGNIVTPGATAAPTIGQALRQTVALGDPTTAANKLAIDSNGMLTSGLYNGATLDRYYNNWESVLLASATRTANTTSPTVINYNGRGCIIFIDLTLASAGGLKVQIQHLDPQSGLTAGFGPIIPAAALTVAGRYSIVFYPTATTTGGGLAAVQNSPLPRRFNVLFVHGDGLNQTYAASIVLLK